MENNNRKQVGSGSRSSFTNDLFGSKESVSPPNSSGIFSSLFPPPSEVIGRNSPTSSELMGSIQRDSAGSQVWDKGTSEGLAKNKEDASHHTLIKERNIFQERAEPCPLSSSLYYGGQEDMYMRSSNGQSLNSYPGFKKDGEGDDQNGNNSDSASRGNWWQGSLYY